MDEKENNKAEDLLIKDSINDEEDLKIKDIPQLNDNQNEQKENENEKKVSNNIECIPLINKEISSEDKKAKEELKSILNNLRENLDKEENKNIEEIYEKHLKKELITNRKLKKEGLCSGKKCLFFIFCVISPIFTIINLIGVFQIISIMKIIFKVFKLSFTCFLFESCSNTEYHDFFNFYFKESLTEPIDYNLMMVMGFLGNILLRISGFTISTILFNSLNVGSLFMIYNFKFESYNEITLKYNFFQILYIFVCYALLFFGVGCSALLSQQILLDSLSKYNKFESESVDENQINDLEQNKKNDLTFFFMVCLTTIIGYYLKYILNIFTAKFFTEGSNIIYYYFLLTSLIYISSIGLSLIFYFILKCVFQENKQNKGDKSEYTICQVCGYLIYKEEKVNKYRTIQTPKCECLRLSCKTINTCCNQSICDFICCQSDDSYEEDKFHCCFESCYTCDCCLKKKNEKKCCECCDCKEISTENNDDYDIPKDIVFYYCYKEKRKQKWFHMFINNETQIKLTKIMMNYFILQFTTIEFEKIYYRNLTELQNEKDYIIKNLLNLKKVMTTTIIHTSIIILFFYITISWGRFFNEDQTDNKNIGQTEDIQQLSKEILEGANIILPFNSIFSVIFTIICFLEGIDLNNIIKDDSDYNNYIYIPIIMNKFFYFTFTYYCIKIAEEEKGFDLVSGSTLISLYLSIWNVFFQYVLNLLPDNILLIIQMIPSVIITLIICYFFFYNLFCRGIFWRTFFYIFFYFFACGGIWFFKCCECCSCCRCCKCFETKENFDKCCDCGIFNKCCEHEELVNKIKGKIPDLKEYLRKIKKKFKKNK